MKVIQVQNFTTYVEVKVIKVKYNTNNDWKHTKKEIQEDIVVLSEKIASFTFKTDKESHGAGFDEVDRHGGCIKQDVAIALLMSICCKWQTRADRLSVFLWQIAVIWYFSDALLRWFVYVYKKSNGPVIRRLIYWCAIQVWPLDPVLLLCETTILCSKRLFKY